jgi:integrase
MSVRPREWQTRNGKVKRALVVDYVDQQGMRRLKTFRTQRQAVDFEATTRVEIKEGVHVPDSASVTVSKACDLWLKTAEADGLERTTRDQYDQHVRLHIKPYLGNTLLSKLNTPTLRAFEERLRDEDRSPKMVRYVVRSLGAMLADAQERGLVVRNAVRDLRSRRKGKDRRQDSRQAKPQVGVDIPTPAEISAIIHTADRHWRPLILTAVFTGLRSSELRGLKWIDVDFKRGELHVRQRADRFNRIGKLKTKAAARTIPLSPQLVNTLREWKLKCPKGELGLVLPNGTGNVEFHVNIIERGLKPTLVRAGVTIPVLDAHGKPTHDEDGKPIVTAKYTGLHALRHFYASWLINRKVDGGLEMPLKSVQQLMGHSSISVTADTYSHLFPRGDDTAALQAAAERLFELHAT